MSTATANGDASSKGAQPASKQFKPSAAGKALDGARKQAGSPVDAQNRKQTPTPQRAWTGTNPITQRPTNSPSLANGSDKSQPKFPSQPQSSSDKQASERLLYLLAHCKGNDATLTLKNGEQFAGVFSGSSTDSSSKNVYTLKMVKRTRLASQQQTNGNTELSDEYTGEGDDHIMHFDVQDTVDLSVANVVTANAHAAQNGSATSSFRTDTEISRDSRMPRERELKKWDGGMDMSLEDMALESSGKHGTTGWDQFAVNEQNFGARTTYNEDDYTTSIDRSNPEYKRRAAEAERIAREIEGSAPANSHVLEERHQNANNDDGMDEEEKYSGVRRESAMAPLSKGGAGSYVPPSRRPITSQPTISGAPFDPAIISLSKPVPAPAAQPAAVPEKAPEPEVPTEALAKTGSIQTAGSDDANKPTTAPAASQPKKTTEDHLRGTADAFKQFANNEKLRLRAAQEAKRTNARHEKNVKLNDLKKFAENFRLKSRVPDDLVPILAKDHEKQLEIKRKAEESARYDEEKRKDHDKEGVAPTPTKSAPSQATTPSDARAHAQQTQSQTRNRVSQNLRGGMQMSSPRVPLQQRHNLPFMNQARGGVPPPQPLPTDLRIPTGPTSTREAELLSPTAANNARLNVNAKEFKFTPGASSFTPTGASPSPQRMPAAPPVEAPVASFFDATEKKSSDTKKDVNTHCDTLRRMREAEYPAEWKKGISENGGIPHSFRTPPTWTVPTERQNIKYLSAFPEARSHSQGPSPMHTPNPAAGPMPHAHQLPAHLQAPHLPNPGQHQRFPNMAQYGVQHGHAQNFDPRMQFPGGPGNSVQNSPRYAPAQMAGGYNSQMGQMPMPQFAGQPMQGYGMSPSMGYRQMQGPGGPMMMQPNQPHPQMNQMRPNYPPGPGYGPNMPQMGGGAPMMTQNPSSSGFMPPQNQGYSPMPPQAQPQMPHMPQQGAGPNGYAGSPRPGPHMMAHSGSHQGFAPHMQQQHSQHGPPFAPPFHGQQQQPQQGQRHPSNGGFVQMTPRSQQAMPSAQQSQGHVPSPGMSGQAPPHGDERK